MSLALPAISCGIFCDTIFKQEILCVTLINEAFMQLSKLDHHIKYLDFVVTNKDKDTKKFINAALDNLKSAIALTFSQGSQGSQI